MSDGGPATDGGPAWAPDVRPGPGAELEVRALTWRPFGRAEPILRGLNLRVSAGERVLVTGPSGSGKSTLLRALAGVLGTTESGELSGSIVVDGVDVSAHVPGGIDHSSALCEAEAATQAGVRPGPGLGPGSGAVAGPRAGAGAASIGLLLQDPGDALVAGTVGRDTAFGLENEGVARSEMWARITRMLEAVSFPYGTEHASSQVSGGEAQRLALAGVLVMGPRLVLLDEPTSMLDPVSAASVRDAVWAIATESGATVIVVEHQLAEWLPRVTRLVVLSERGDIVADGESMTTLSGRRDALTRSGVWAPGSPAPVPRPVPAELCRPAGGVVFGGGPVVSARGLGVVLQRPVSFGQQQAPGTSAAQILIDASVDLHAGEITAVVGASGAGKSTLTALLAGLSRPTSGEVVWVGADLEAASGARAADAHPGRWSSRRLAERVGWVPQNAELAIVARTVRDDVLSTSVLLGRDAHEAGKRTDALLAVLGLTPLAADDPHQLSGGELRRVALASAIAHGPALLVLDEPTTGLDRHTWSAVAGVIVAARAAGVAVVVATHDPLLMQLADRTVRLDRGRVVEWSARVSATDEVRAGAGAIDGQGSGLRAEGGTAELAGGESAVDADPGACRDTAADDTGGIETAPAVPDCVAREPIVRAARAGHPFGFAKYCGPLSLLAGGLLLLVGSLFITGIGQAVVGLVVLFAAAPFVLDLRTVPLRRLAPGLLAAASVAFSTWLLSPDQSLLSGITAGLRIAFFVLPGVLLAGHVDPSALGDHLGQLLRLPARPVVAATAALQQFSTLTEQWQQLRRVHRVRGLSAGRSPVKRVTQFASLTFALLVQSVRKAGRMAVAMDARGFSRVGTSGHARTWAEPALWTRADTVLLLVVGLVASVPAVVGLLL
ncbi:hypothetical protein BH09ACT6_BH09ACT6_00630 [soil metagenome]